MEPRLRNLIWDSQIPLPNNGTLDPTTLSQPFTATLAPIRSQTFDPLRTVAIDPLLENATTGANGSERSRRPQDQLSAYPSDWASNGEFILDSLVLPPIQQTLQGNSKSAVVTNRVVKNSAPLAEVLNSVSPEANPRALDTLHVQALQQVVENIDTGSHSLPARSARSPTPGSKRRRLDEPTRKLPKPTARKSSKRQQTHQLLPPLLAPLHDPPVDARVVPSMNTDAPKIPDLQGQMRHQSTSTNEREASHRAQTILVQSETTAQISPADAQPGPSEAVAASTIAPITEEDANVADTGTTEKSKTKVDKRATSKRVKWTPEETQFLIDGVERFGIGNWKKILECEDYHFKGERNSIDLKDRFRTCFPDEYRRSGSQKGKIDSHLDTTTGKRRGRGGRTTVELQKMGVLKEHQPFPKQDRRQRKNFTAEEDDALLKGFLKYPAQWKKIQMDPDLGLQQRTRTDLRDRFRNRYPQRFKEAGYVHKAKQGESDNISEDILRDAAGEISPQDALREPREDVSEVISATAAISTSTQPSRTSEPTDLSNILTPSNAPSNHRMSSKTPVSTSQPENTNTLRLLTSGWPDHDDFSSMSLDDEDDDASIEGVHLSRAIFDWADQNKLNKIASNAAANTGGSSSNALRDGTSNVMRIDPILLHTNTNNDSGPVVSFTLGMSSSHDKTPLASIDQYDLNPLISTEKLPSLGSIVAGQAVVGSASVPLSKILNGG
ncbi:hypothetical protein BT63DRAFT_12330 [Microthyrium microscopicum]|uniref:Myb-like domain-containing protein n=1 Tax=Microthyrium microscopicum TaxID=703497 RepID=A0A6A6UQF1_9PEZI|nr:hypothetical protein BT63DRAFT_12330 [Microthyrium microscopicum]